MPPSNQVVSSSESTDTPDYGSVAIPSKPPTEYTYHERRADLLQQIRDLGTPDAINQTEAAERYGVSQQQISKDLDRIGESVRERITDRDRRTLATDSVLRRVVRELLAEGEYRKAAKTELERAEWIREEHEAEEFARRLDRLEDAVAGDGGEEGGEVTVDFETADT